MNFFNPPPKYEYTIVAIPRSRRVGRLAFGIIYISMGFLFLIAGRVLGPGYDKSAGFVTGCYWFGCVALLAGAAYLVWAVRATQQPQLTNAGAAAQAADEVVAKARATRFGVGRQKVFAGIGQVVGGLAGLITFVVVYIAAVDSVGWVIGLALGWIPACLAAALAFFLGRYLWLLAAILIAWALLHQ